ncbi:hypothetical protein Daesc_006000 [Daldinia eschscholtzii]|uniref:Uncharacterized protein n=1 Tax=Daldinia eschscholtzii TaxID=292717 RepID=A0AAX6MM25_9PEZI
MPRRITPKGPDATQDPAKEPSPAFSKYQELVPELKLKIWRHAQLSPGVHFLSISCRTRLIDGHIAHVLHINPWADSSTDRSTWRIRKNVAKVDKYSWDVTERLLKVASTMRLWDFPRSRNPDAFVNPAQDLECTNKYVQLPDIARRDKLDSFTDRDFTYYEVQEKDTSCLVIHEKLWKVFNDLKDLWTLAKNKVPPPYKIREPKLKVLVYAESKKNSA